MAGTAREEAERLVAAVLAMAARTGLRDAVTGAAAHIGSAGRQANGSPGAWATGSAECCVCPICRVIAGMRDPTPEAAERLATGAGELATGVAGMLRALSSMSGGAPPSRPRPASAPPPDPDIAWSAATHAGPPRSADGDSSWSAAGWGSNREAEAEGDSSWPAASRGSNREAAAEGNSSWPTAGRGSNREAAAEDDSPWSGVGRESDREAGAAPEDDSPWSAATRESNREAEAAERAAQAARRAARVAEDEARRARERAEDTARRARHLAEEQERRAQGGTGRPFDVWAVATASGPGGGTGWDSGGIRPRNSAGTPGPRTRDAVEFDRESASGTVDGGVGESGVAGTDNVDHDGADPPATGTGDARHGEV